MAASLEEPQVRVVLVHTWGVVSQNLPMGGGNNTCGYVLRFVASLRFVVSSSVVNFLEEEGG